MIKGFACKQPERFYEGTFVKRFSSIERQAEKKLRLLHAATSLQDLRALRGNRFEALVGKRKGQYSIRINDQWRLCFTWDQGADNVEIVDYH